MHSNVWTITFFSHFMSFQKAKPSWAEPSQAKPITSSYLVKTHRNELLQCIVINVYCTDERYVHSTHFVPSVRSFIRAKHAVILLKQCDNQPASGQNRMLTKCFLASMCVLMFVCELSWPQQLNYINCIRSSKFPVCTFPAEKCANNRFHYTNNMLLLLQQQRWRLLMLLLLMPLLYVLTSLKSHYGQFSVSPQNVCVRALFPSVAYKPHRKLIVFHFSWFIIESVNINWVLNISISINVSCYNVALRK